MSIDKQQIKQDLIDQSNKILTRYGELESLDSVSIMNMSQKVVFLGSLRVLDERNVNNVKKDVVKEFSKYGDISIRDEKIIPCCAPRYFHISFNVSIDKV